MFHTAKKLSRSFLRRLGVIGLGLSLAGTMAGCSDACFSLAQTICDCGLNATERDACLQAVQAAQSNEPSAAELAICESKIDTCTCDALKEGDLAACGLAKEGN